MNRIIFIFLLLSTCVASFSQVIETRKNERDGFQWIQLLNGNYRGVNQGARSINGTDIIPLYKGYKMIVYDAGNVDGIKHEGYFRAITQNNCQGIYSKTGQEIIPVSRGYTSVYLDIDGQYYHMEKGSYVGICDIDGKEIISTSRGYSSAVFVHDAKHKGYFSVSKGDKLGVCDMSGAEIIPCAYNSVIFVVENFKYQKDENEYIDLPLTLDENGYAIPYTIQSEQKKSQEELIESMTPEEREKLMMLLLLLQSKGAM